MIETEFFTITVARELARGLACAGVSLPVRGQVEDAAPDDDGLEVRVDEVEEVITGNYTVRLDGSVVLTLRATGNDRVAVLDTARRVRDVACEVMAPGRWKRRALEPLGPYLDEEYEAAPYVVLELVSQPGNVEVGDVGYEFSIGFRAYVQF